MDSTHTKRKLAAILAADVVGYSRLMSEHEERTLVVLKECFQFFQQIIPKYDGRIFGGAGDSVIAEFPSAVEAVRAALQIQNALVKRNSEVPSVQKMRFRIGISIGDVIVEGDNLMGDGVNIAARLESLAPPDGINISGYVYHQVRNKLQAGFVNAGRQSLKNIPDPVQVYQVVSESVTRKSNSKYLNLFRFSRRYAIVASVVVSMLFTWLIVQRNLYSQSSDIQSVAVLPFLNMSGDPQQDYFVDGITEDIITDISRLSKLTVIAWNSSSKYKGKKVNPGIVGKELGVTFVLDGSVRKVGDRLRITAKLVNTRNGNHVWAERYDRNFTEVFEVQDEVTQKIVNALAIRLTESEKEKLGHTGTSNFSAYDAFLKGQQFAMQRTKQGNSLARDAFRRAVELDPNYARAYGALAILLTRDYRNDWTDLSLSEARVRALELAQKAVSLDRTSPQAYWALGYVNLLQKNYDAAAEAAKQAVKLAPSYADGYGLLAFINNSQGNAEDAVRHIAKAMSLNPYYTYEYPSNLGRAYYTLGKYDEAIQYLKDAIQRNENSLHPRLYLAASYVRLGQLEDAKWEITQTEILNPTTTISLLANTLAIKDRQQLDLFLEDLRKAGLSE